MRILGLSAFYHDSAAAIVEDGRLIAAAQEERFTRKKHDARFPEHAIAACLAEAGGSVAGLSLVFVPYPLLKVIETGAPSMRSQPLTVRGIELRSST